MRDASRTEREQTTDADENNTGLTAVLIINQGLWNEAKWNGVCFAEYEDREPCIGLTFRNAPAADEIFRHWQKRLGRIDEFDELRLSFTFDRKRPNEYITVVAPDIPGLVQRYRAEGMERPPDNLQSRFLTDLTWHKMNIIRDAPTPPAIERFRAGYKAGDPFLLAPAHLESEKAALTTRVDLKINYKIGILKHLCYFKEIEDLQPGVDIEAELPWCQNTYRGRSPGDTK